jgi:hypothetical protein
MTVAPLIADNVLITGISGAEFGIRGFIDGWDPETGKHLWRRYTIPARGEPGNETWPQDTDAWKTGSGSSWITGSYDPDLDLTYWGTGNPAPWASQTRPGDNLFTASVLAIRQRAVGHRRRVLEPGARGAQERTARRLGVDLRPDAGLKTRPAASAHLMVPPGEGKKEMRHALFICNRPAPHGEGRGAPSRTMDNTPCGRSFETGAGAPSESLTHNGANEIGVFQSVMPGLARP